MEQLRTFSAAASRRVDRIILAVSCQERRLIGIALLRIIIGLATILYCLSDYGHRQFFWGPHSYDSPQAASSALPRWGFSLYFVSNSQAWFELLFHLTIVASALFMVFGGRILTLVQAVLMWSLHNRNQDILEGGDNLAQILILFMLLTVSNGYFAPGAKARRAALRQVPEPTFGTALHNLGAYLIVFQVAIVYLASGYWKIAGQVWQQGVAMYYVSRINGFAMSTTYAHLMGNPFIGTAVSYATIFIELAFPFAILSSRAWIRKAQTLSLEGLHLGIMAFMGLVCFGLIMIGADCTAMRDEDYRSLWIQVAPLCKRLTRRLQRAPALPLESTAPPLDLREETRA
jgi:hypothetical protein